ncbi:uncharacterized protein LOC130693211 [Daphnia carinata]|uniref:uncharacterized protein LOC130693211 n=1 Tax=Daphnia carinata TaxID=120202 RepID=UPI002868AC6B|nr:uncharacterized protein LOC130693211 [Daphnia carinata]
MWPVIIVILLTTVNSQNGIENDDATAFDTEKSTKCMSYRYIPCHKSVNRTTFLEDELTGEVLKPLANESVSLCISYRYITCRKDWPSYTVILEDEEERLRRQNANYIEKIKSCENEKSNYTSQAEAALSGTLALTNQLKLCETAKEELAKKLNASEQNQQFLTRKLNEARTKNLTTESDPLSKIINNERKLLYSYIAPSLLNKPYPGVERFTRYEVARTGTLPLMNVERLMPELGQVINDVTSFYYPLTIPPCADVEPNTRSVFIAVNSLADYVKERNEIRQTWPQNLKVVQDMGLLGMIRYGFFVGLPESNTTQAQIEKENEMYGDMIQVDVSDSYIDPMKMAGLLNWLNNNCANVDFVFKMNDYMFLDVRNLAQFVRFYYKSVKTLFGDQSPLAQPLRSGRWAQPVTEWPWSTYPRHVFRHAFFMHGTSILPLLAAFQTTPTIPLYYVYVTGMCTEKGGVTTRFSSGNFSMPLSGLAFQLGTAPTCKQTQQIAWATHNSTDVHADKMKTHHEVEEYYKNFYQCNIVSNGTLRKVDPKDPVKFFFESQ